MPGGHTRLPTLHRKLRIRAQRAPERERQRRQQGERGKRRDEGRNREGGRRERGGVPPWRLSFLRALAPTSD